MHYVSCNSCSQAVSRDRRYRAKRSDEGREGKGMDRPLPEILVQRVAESRLLLPGLSSDSHTLCESQYPCSVCEASRERHRRRRRGSRRRSERRDREESLASDPRIQFTPRRRLGSSSGSILDSAVRKFFSAPSPSFCKRFLINCDLTHRELTHTHTSLS